MDSSKTKDFEFFKKMGRLYIEYYVYLKKKNNPDWTEPLWEEEEIVDITGSILLLLNHIAGDDQPEKDYTEEDKKNNEDLKLHFD